MASRPSSRTKITSESGRRRLPDRKDHPTKMETFYCPLSSLRSTHLSHLRYALPRKSTIQTLALVVVFASTFCRASGRQPSQHRKFCSRLARFCAIPTQMTQWLATSRDCTRTIVRHMTPTRKNGRKSMRCEVCFLQAKATRLKW